VLLPVPGADDRNRLVPNWLPGPVKLAPSFAGRRSPWMPDAPAVRLVHPLCLPDWARCGSVHLALPLPSRFAGPDWGAVVASPC